MRSLAWRSGVLLSFRTSDGLFWILPDRFWLFVTPLATVVPAGRCVTGFVLPFAQALGTFGLL